MNNRDNPENSIAVVGMAGRFPGASDINSFWNNLHKGIESITRMDPEEVAFKKPANAAEERVYARGILNGAAYFDASFFGYTPKEAESMDPQQRVFLETAWSAMEHAGYDVERIKMPVGLFAGSGLNTYLLYNLCSSREFIEEILDNHQVSGLAPLLGNDKDFLATRVAYKLGLKGPVVSVQTACSTSLVAVVMAWQSLMNYQCDMAMAGGVSISFPQNRSYPYTAGAMVSRDGHCRAFDADAQGMLYGGGAGVVVLKRLEDALVDGDSVYALISGAAINNDGSSKASFMAPSIEGQADVILSAQAMAGVDPETISYVEAHGTGTPLGDPIEIAGLTRAFQAGTNKKQFCAIGSVKTNIGHLETAAGVSGLIKTILSLYNKEIPASLNFRAPNPKIDFGSTPFFVNAENRPWKVNGIPRRAGVSSFGVGGTNAHVVLQEAPELWPAMPSRDRQILILSARTETALETMRSKLADYLESQQDINLADAAFTLQRGRKLFSCRNYIVASTARQAASLLRTPGEAFSVNEKAKARKTSVVFLFPGQGTQYVDMGQELFYGEAVFRETVEQCAEILKKDLGEDIKQVMYPDKGKSAIDASRINQTSIAQPAIFIVEYALARLWMNWGVKPDLLIGHSIGEYTAAVLSGALELKDALSLLAARARMMQGLLPGAMMAVRIAAKDIETHLTKGISIAAVNSPKLCVVSGQVKELGALRDILRKKEIATSFLHTSHAFHSFMMEPMLQEFSKAAKHIPARQPKIPWVSTVTGGKIGLKELKGGDYWVRQIRQPVRFADAIACACKEKNNLFLEVGAGQTLCQLTRQNTGKDMIAVSSLGPVNKPGSDLNWMLCALGRLWTAGVSVDWEGFSGNEKRKRVALPAYPFERKKHWVEPVKCDKFQRIEMLSTCSDDKNQDSKLQHNQVEEPVVETSRKGAMLDELLELLQRYSGTDYSQADPGDSFMDMGFDSLFLTQFSQGVSQHFGVKITFRQMLEDLCTLSSLIDYIDNKMPPDDAVAVTPLETSKPVPDAVPGALQNSQLPGSYLQSVIQQQMSLMGQQLELLRHSGNSETRPAASGPKRGAAEPAKSSKPVVSAVNMGKRSQFGPFKPIEKGVSGGLTDTQQKALDVLVKRYNQRTAKSKEYAQKHRPFFCDPRAAGNYRQMWKEMVYPIVCARSKGSKIWDIDGNEYIDITMGFGANYLGHSPDFVMDALREQMAAGIEIGPQSPVAGEVAELICEFSGMERVAFCNTGSEAVMASFRIARTVTGREKIVYFHGDYHGVFDEVLGGPALVDGLPGAMPIAPGIPHLPNVMVLEYGNQVSLETIRKHANEIAGVIVEPVQ